MQKSSRLVATGVGAAVLVAVGAGAWALLSDGVPESAPYSDTRAAGRLTLCDAEGNRVIEGSIGTTPFVASVLASTGLPDGVDATGAVGTLFVHQPRLGVTSEEFSGAPLTSTVPLADPTRTPLPVDEDSWSIEDFITAYPAELDGFVQLRLLLGTPATGTLTEEAYDSLDLRIDGDTWRAVDPGNGTCAAVGN